MKVKMTKRAYGHDSNKDGVNLPGRWYEKDEVYEMNSLHESFKKLGVCEECKKEEPKKAEPKKGAPENKAVKKKANKKSSK